MRIFLAGATGVIGIRLLPLLVADGNTVAGMTRSAQKADKVRALGAEPVVCDVFDAPALTDALAEFEPDAVLHEVDVGGVVVRYGQLYGPGTFYETQLPRRPRIHVDDAARSTPPLILAPSGVFVLVDDGEASNRS